MTKILFVIQEYTQGGINKCLENMLGILDSSQYEIFIYSLYEDGGDYYKEVFDKHIVGKSLFYKYIHDHVQTRKIIGLYNKLTKRYNFGWLYKYEVNYLQKKNNFDIVVAYHEGMTVEFASYFKNTRKITWFHCDPKFWGLTQFNIYRDSYRTMDTIVCVSNVVRNSLTQMFPEYKKGIKVIHNLLDIESIRKKAEYPISDYCSDNNIIKLLSIGRSSKIKQFEKIPVILRQILDKGVKNVVWHIIASGNECNEEIKKAIKDNDVTEYVKLLGEKNNPYPYIAASDILISTSYSEAYPTVINEAQVLGIPVIANDYPSAKEIVDPASGYICNIENMPNLIADLSEDNLGKFSRCKEEIANFSYDNAFIVQQINKLFS